MAKDLVTDRTAICTDWDCGMKYYWYRLFDGTGIVPLEEPSYYKDGRDFASTLEEARTEGFDLDEWMVRQEEEVRRLLPLGKIRAAESAVRLLGMICAYKLYTEPRILQQYEIIALEQELILDGDQFVSNYEREFGKPQIPLGFGERGLYNLLVASTPDLIKMDRDTGALVYQDDKSTANASNQWTAHWNYAVQLHIGLAAMEEEYRDKTLGYAHIMGMRKGQVSYGALAHPYVYANRTPKGEWRRKGYKGCEKMLTIENPGGVRAWVEHLGSEVAQEMFPWSVPVFLNKRLVYNMIVERTIRMAEIERWGRLEPDDRQILAPGVFPKSLNQCYPSMGSVCPYLQACHNATVGDDPLGSELYGVRTPHHNVEILMNQEVENG